MKEKQFIKYIKYGGIVLLKNNNMSQNNRNAVSWTGIFPAHKLNIYFLLIFAILIHTVYYNFWYMYMNYKELLLEICFN